MSAQILRRALAAILVSSAAAVAGPAPRAATVTAVQGSYSGEVLLGPVLLDGRYPLAIGDSTPGTLDVTTSPKGVLSAKVTFAAQTEDAVGKLRVRRDGIRLDLRGKIDAGKIALTATLRGNAFVGTVKFGGRTFPCRIDVAGVAPLRARIEFALSQGKGSSTKGLGTITVGRESVPVAVQASVRKERVTLRASGGGTTLRLDKGEVVGATVRSATWKAQGFGAAAAGGAALVLTQE